MESRRSLLQVMGTGRRNLLQVKGTGRRDRLLRWIGIMLALGLGMTGCEDKEDYSYLKNCSYEIEEKGNLGQVFENQEIGAWVDEHCIRITDQNITVNGYIFSLVEFYCDSKIASPVYRIQITNEDGTNLTQEQYEELQKEIQEGDLECNMVRYGCVSFLNELRQENGETNWYIGNLMDNVNHEDKTWRDAQGEGIKALALVWDSKEAGILMATDHTSESQVRTFSNDSVEDGVQLIECTTYGIDIYWDTTDVLEEYKAELESLAPGEDAELVGYNVYENLEVKLIDGSLIGLDRLSEAEEGVQVSAGGENEDSALAGYCALWNDEIRLDQIESIVIDGVEYSN